MNLYLIRHAEPETLDYDNFFPGPNLGTKGHAQAKVIADYLHDKQITKIYSSDFRRVVQTMQPFLKLTSPHIQPSFVKALREREASVESHASLVERVQTWFQKIEHELTTYHVAIFSHCGPLNMILEYLDPDKNILDYPFTSPHGCHTPLAGIWMLRLEDELKHGYQIQVSINVIMHSSLRSILAKGKNCNFKPCGLCHKPLHL
ncbi:MAG: hypothetical protein B6242_16685 [Anaerolineaceae bacterium 4572_78]|nr:MAG: hypothetical protein B6242_16685 [Anaerolineaceae bacterium 4572_78]